jgi:hypothetical protein
VSAYINTGFKPGSMATVMLDSDLSHGCYPLNNIALASTAFATGLSAATGREMRLRPYITVSLNFFGTGMSSGGQQVTTDSRRLHCHSRRQGATVDELWIDGVLKRAFTPTTIGTVLPDQFYFLHAFSNTASNTPVGFSSYQLAASYVGASLTASQFVELPLALNELLTTIGAITS